MEDHVDRQTQMGTRVLINDGWYNTFVAIFVSAKFRLLKRLRFAPEAFVCLPESRHRLKPRRHTSMSAFA